MAQKTVFITGTSSGFGQLTVTRLLQSGHRVIAGLRGGEDRGRKIFASLTMHFDRNLFFADLELSDSSRLHDNLLTIDGLLQKNFADSLDILILNAGYGLFGAAEDSTDLQLRHQFEVNFFSCTTLIRHFLPRLRARAGKILVLSSVAGRFTFPLYGAYSASKHALEAWIDGLHFDLQFHPEEPQAPRVQICLIEPGGYATAFNRNLTHSQRPGSPYAQKLEQLTKFLVSPHRKAGDPQDVADLLVQYVDANKIPLRKIMGKDAQLLVAISALIPTQWRINLIEFFFRRIVFKNR